MLKDSNKLKKNSVVLTLAILLATITVLYERLVMGKEYIITVLFACLVLVFFCIIRALFSLFQKLLHCQENIGHRWFAKCLVLLLLMWLPWVVLCFPGNMTWDTGSSILYDLGIDRSNVNNPCFQNFLFGAVCNFGLMINNTVAAIALYSIFQAIIYAVGIAYALDLLIHWGVPKGIVIAAICLYGLCPFVPIYALTMAKDSNFAIAVFVFSVLLMKLCVEGDAFLYSKSKILLLMISGCALTLFRNHGLVIAVVCLLIMIVKQYKIVRKISMRLIVVLAVVVATNYAVPLVLQAPETEASESFSVPLQQTAYYFNTYPDEITDDEYNAVNAVVPVELFVNYTPQLSDPIKDNFNDNASKEEVASYFRVWWNQLLKHPGAYLTALYHQSYIYYTPNTLSEIKPDRFFGFWVDSTVIDSAGIETPDNTKLVVAQKIDDEIKSLPVFGVFQKIGIYTWILLITVGYLIYAGKSNLLVSLLPAIIVFVGCCFSPVNGYFRYALPFVLTIPALCIGVIWAPCRKNCESKVKGK